MNTLTEQRVQKVTSKGQFTLPAKWRHQYGGSQVMVNTRGSELVIMPMRDMSEVKEEWETLWDAKRDNNGKGIEAGEFLKIMKEVRQEKEW